MTEEQFQVLLDYIDIRITFLMNVHEGSSASHLKERGKYLEQQLHDILVTEKNNG